ncbi:MAG: hypothetical protein HQ552_13025 [Desulfobacteraceae bacterium]|nr:hypothetical protein [Desulfobacteraceae bacterium]
MVTLTSTFIADQRKKKREKALKKELQALSHKLNQANEALHKAEKDRQELLHKLLTQVNEIEITAHLRYGAWAIKNLQQYEKQFPGCSEVPSDSKIMFESCAMTFDLEHPNRILALQRFIGDNDLCELVAPLPISFIHAKNKSKFDKDNHDRRDYKSFYVVHKSVPDLEDRVIKVKFEQSVSNAYYIDLYVTAKLQPDDRQNFCSAQDFDDAEIKVVYTHLREIVGGYPCPEPGSLTPTSFRIDIRSESYSIDFHPDEIAANEEDVSERWIAYGIPKAGTFFQRVQD